MIVAMVGWGWAWVGIRAAVRHYEPGALAMGRYAVASLVLLPVWWARGRTLPARKDLAASIVSGLLGITLYNLGLNTGEKTVTAGAASLIASIIPVLFTLGARVFFKERLPWLGWVGVGISFAGVGLIALSGDDETSIMSVGALFVLGASFCAAGFGLINKRLLQRYAALDVTTWAIWAGTAGLLFFAPATVRDVATAPLSATANVIVLGVFPGALCYALWSYVVARWPMSRVASWMFLIPVVAVLMGWWMLNELPAPLAFVGGAITLAGVAMVNARTRQ